MTYIPEAHVDFLLEWDREPVLLSREIKAVLDSIGPTPPDLYGNSREARVTPCAVETRAGSLHEIAMVSVQREAPIRYDRQLRLASEIGRAFPSPYALPYEVRVASSHAEELRMGFSPSLIQMPDGAVFAMNGMTNFFVERGYRAADARVLNANYFDLSPRPPLIEYPEDLIYFVAEGDPGW